MNSLLTRQVKKFLKTVDPGDIQKLLEAIDESYTTYEDHISMLQRAIKLSSDELFEANQKLRDEAESLKEINKNLEFMLSSMQIDVNINGAVEFDTLQYIQKQSAEIVKINQQRENLVNSLEMQNQELNEYAHVVSHDLKAPLRNINALINWVIEDNNDKLDNSSKDSLNLILFNIEKMDLLIKGILDYSSIGKVESESRLIDFNELINEIFRTISLPENIKILVNNKLPSMYGNFYRFRQLFQNLIENAIKYNDKKNGLIEIGCVSINNITEFYIKDNGKGIPAAYFEKVFNVFTKLESDNQSSGIGLSIVKKIVKYYQGNIRLKSIENEGTIFYFTLKNDLVT